jgi:hypothetical protein
MQKFKEQPRLESITVPFIRAGVAWTGLITEGGPHFNHAWRSPVHVPQMQQAKRWPARLLLFMPQRENAL